MRSIHLHDIVGTTIDDDAILVGLAPDISLPLTIRKKMVASYDTYRTKKGSNSIAALALQPSWPQIFSALYKGRSKKNSLDWIGKIAKTTKYGYCPMCGSETHGTVEHFLPRKPWAEFSFFSLNLVPSCGPCNTKRGNRANKPGLPLSPLHPYYDHKLLDKRLHITKISPPFAAPKFEYEVFASVSARNRPRVEHHLSHSIDENQYQQFCVNRWSEARTEVRRFTTLAAWKKSLKNRLDDAQSASGINSWRTAFYAGLVARPDAVSWLFKNRKDP
ncbi:MULTISPECIES: hypothetical protein [Achromobacter]|uniref:HNH endonuclease n=1 Tax=Achromobacter spanius TaxID=217203 RepID=A0ABY8GXX4_9BURK|nr:MULTISPECIES: hypothetical protein [Achromobacter]WAI81018.1 hypothetical protein N8Z00_15825 [Achromobacter spanius]WEX96536.1 hypothetical protein N3Z32_10430 [Achromobacter sp. SS2-2022]WFP09747.1 hypothetical protein P8T11_07675 [Achromobacter spanius]